MGTALTGNLSRTGLSSLQARGRPARVYTGEKAALPSQPPGGACLVMDGMPILNQCLDKKGTRQCGQLSSSQGLYRVTKGTVCFIIPTGVVRRLAELTICHGGSPERRLAPPTYLPSGTAAHTVGLRVVAAVVCVRPYASPGREVGFAGHSPMECVIGSKYTRGEPKNYVSKSAPGPEKGSGFGDEAGAVPY
ncbi:hypothetical protein E1301_Tti013652 [Triplophysa tibetana]|uniref:Uncharacterized protein n=1 Tax=Triplophysa tibetana TaxID=1572043 RepID=A0A5A9PLA2_9TELE|nr:hypothetical protein E1301_Tti013652 [Triplophysa tibetana]